MNSDGWTISVDATSDADVTENEVDQLVESFRPHGGALAVGPGNRLGVTFSINAADKIRAIDQAVKRGAEIFRMIVRRDLGRDFTIVRLDACTYAEHDADLAQPAFPELVGVAELAALLGVSAQRASELRSKTGFPAPTATLRSGPIWIRSNVEHFASTWKRTPGRPRKADAPVVN